MNNCPAHACSFVKANGGLPGSGGVIVTKRLEAAPALTGSLRSASLFRTLGVEDVSICTAGAVHHCGGGLGALWYVFGGSTRTRGEAAMRGEPSDTATALGEVERQLPVSGTGGLSTPLRHASLVTGGLGVLEPCEDTEESTGQGAGGDLNASVGAEPAIFTTADVNPGKAAGLGLIDRGRASITR